MEKEYKFDIKKYAHHHKKFPWQLMIRIIIASLLFLGLYYAYNLNEPNKKIKNEQEIEIEILN